MRRIRKALAAALVCVCAFACTGSAMAATDVPHFTFTNIQEDQPDLYVTKTVVSAMEGYEAPEGDEFTFVLKWDRDGDGYLEFAENASYFVYDEFGVQVKNPDTSDGSYKTSSTGRFTLKDGQYARFEWAGEVEYEIYEEDKNGYTQILPAGGTASGTVAADGTVVGFTNLYVPVTDHDETMIAIRKDASWPDGYETPDFDGMEFEFTIMVDGALYTNEPYEIYDAYTVSGSSAAKEIGEGITESDGTFTIAPGTTVVFDGVDVGVDYVIRETGADTGWRAVGSTEAHGSTTAPITYAYFANAGASFIVEKDRADGITTLDTEFTFTLTGASGDPVSGAGYFVYDKNGNLVSDEALSTDQNGQFTLKAGQRAVFYGLTEGAEYTVTEADAEGYAVLDAENVTVDLDDVQDVQFLNEQLTYISLKKMIGNSGNRTLEGAEFTVYDTEGNTIDVQTTDVDGMLTFTGLTAGDYVIKETGTPDGYVATGEDIYVTVPYTMTAREVSEQHIDTEAEDFAGLYGSGVYYFYELTYDVYNDMSVLEMPNTGGWAWVIGLCAAAGVAVALVSVTLYRRNRKTAVKQEG